ncbi:TAP-like protein-domain-containing protein [Dichomitus squalens]|uniref:TAP-like protein-domain-containing protein n=1 Tax=Dichomitus squalens TaxID=114155 RepID=A0A4Q9PGD3_9APHY|nr:TAP-like protein-domain-containing protein [Dichomitus squalens]
MALPRSARASQGLRFIGVCCAVLSLLAVGSNATGQWDLQSQELAVADDSEQIVAQMTIAEQATAAAWKHNLGALFAGGALALAGSTASVPPVQGSVGELFFGNCTDNHALPGAECGYAIVPLDYTNSSAGVAKIALGRYNATASPRKGVVFVNPGGPGGPGVNLATEAGSFFQELIGEDYDIIGFDPRGIGLSEPQTKCFPKNGSREAFIANTVLDRGYDVSPNLTDPYNRFHLIETQRDANALYQAQFQVCAQTMGETIKYAGTTSVVRDIDFITTLLEGTDSLINFYGFSYGTVMGQYLVNVFPDRVGRVVIDGVVDADSWANKAPYQQLHQWLNSTDATYEVFIAECAKAGPASCALAQKDNEDPEDILDRVERWIDGLYDAPLAVPNATRPGILTNGRARLFIEGGLESPTGWPQIAAGLAEAMRGDGAAVLNVVNTRELVDLERSAVSCNDQRPFAPPTAETIVDAGLEVLKHVSRFFWSVIIAEPDSGCQYWPVTPPERYLGPWNKTLNNPILIISNTHDPATPLVNGEAVHGYLPNSSALLVQNGPGHTSNALTSRCTIRSTRAYFANGTLPAAGTVCEVDQSPFPPPSDSTAPATAAASAKMRVLDHIHRMSPNRLRMASGRS